MSLALPPSTRQALERLDRPPDDGTWRDAVDRFVADARAVLDAGVEFHLFGSRARGDHHADSDVDIAVVFPDLSVPRWQRLRLLSALAYDVLLDTGIRVEPHPVTAAGWAAGASGGFVDRIRRDARRV